jgi:signal transduction histidine kinase
MHRSHHHYRDYQCVRPSPVRRAIRGALQRRLFWWFGISIVLTGAVVALVMHLLRPAGAGWSEEVLRAHQFVGHRMAAVWSDPDARRDLTRDLSRDIGLDVRVEDAQGHELDAAGDACTTGDFVVPVTRGTTSLGVVRCCWGADLRARHWGVPFALLAAGVVLWGISGLVARHIARPMSDLVRVTQEIGAGNLASRLRLGRHRRGEAGVLAEAVNEMAERIEKQVGDQRELLAAVSHEIRSPLARIRVVLELLRERHPGAREIDTLEREVLDIDRLVGDLLASSRLEFSALVTSTLSARELAEHALERAGLDASLLVDESGGVSVTADATLIGRALENLLDNAKSHGGGVASLRVAATPDAVVFEVSDRGPGFSEEMLRGAFVPFRREGSANASSLGLGLSLVRRIALSHGGDAWAENRPGGGATTAFRIARDPTSPVGGDEPVTA